MKIKYDNTFISDSWLKEEFEDIVSRFSRGDEKPIPNAIRIILEYIFERKLNINEKSLSSSIYKGKKESVIDSGLIIKQVELLSSYGNVGSHYAIDNFNIDSETAIKFLGMFYLFIHDKDPSLFPIVFLDESENMNVAGIAPTSNVKDKKAIPKGLVRSRAVGAVSFIKYYKHGFDEDIFDQMNDNENYKESSIKTKISSAKGILNSDHLLEVLELIANSTIVSDDTKINAEKYLLELQKERMSKVK